MHGEHTSGQRHRSCAAGVDQIGAIDGRDSGAAFKVISTCGGTAKGVGGAAARDGIEADSSVFVGGDKVRDNIGHRRDGEGQRIGRSMGIDRGTARGKERLLCIGVANDHGNGVLSSMQRIDTTGGGYSVLIGDAVKVRARHRCQDQFLVIDKNFEFAGIIAPHSEIGEQRVRYARQVCTLWDSELGLIDVISLWTSCSYI